MLFRRKKQQKTPFEEQLDKINEQYYEELEQVQRDFLELVQRRITDKSIDIEQAKEKAQRRTEELEHRYNKKSEDLAKFYGVK